MRTESPFRELTEFETEKIVLCVAAQLLRYAGRYDERKYPPGELDRLRAAFTLPDSVSESDIEAALVWKYGKYSDTEKRNYPAAQRELAARIARLWPENAMRPTQNPKDDFDRWRQLLGTTSFITICFLLHLVQPRRLPILDKNNFLSVNRRLARVRPDFRERKKKPSQFEDLLLVRDFGIAVLCRWEEYTNSEKPSADMLDRYLMMRGKEWRDAR